MKVSICIPTYNRVHLLVEALESCINQTFKPHEIIIGDDSTNYETERKIKNYKVSSEISIRYFHNVPSLKQSKNINMLFNAARGDKVMLLHDDDLLLPRAVEKLVNCFYEQPDVKIAFGKQYILNGYGQIDQAASEKLNTDYYRVHKYEGSILTSLEAGFVQQFPNDGYMLDASVLKNVNYRTNSSTVGELGYGCEYDFGIQLGMHNYKMYFVNEYIGKYRLSTANSISSSVNDDACLKSFLILRKIEVPKSSQLLKELHLKNKAGIAVSQAAIHLTKKEAVQLFFSKWHRGKIFTLGGIKRLMLILFPCFFATRA
ncbi:glycosyltransferase family 2 protein [Catalinimonas sp. 4WD22]|uniref:glycosyltransferase family 2 protein n=1 Tax=Catalinimonas locisalis TaxID=3133978 RepID=UPI0031010060